MTVACLLKVKSLGVMMRGALPCLAAAGVDVEHSGHDLAEASATSLVGELYCHPVRSIAAASNPDYA